MNKIEHHIIHGSHSHFKLIDEYCLKAKNLYNYANYQIRFNNLVLFNDHMNYYEIEKLVRHGNNSKFYYDLPKAQVAQQVLKKLSENWIAFNSANRDYVIHKNKYRGRPKPPKYLKSNSRFELYFTSQAFSFKSNRINLGKAMNNLTIKTKHNLVKFVRICPINSFTYDIQIGYEYEQNPRIKSNNFAAIDLGINNLATISFTNRKPLIVNGKPIKSINQYYNKQLAKTQSYNLPKKYIDKLALKRNNKLNDYLHKSSRFIVNQLVDSNISTLVIGYNKGWKQGAKMRKVNNQKFVQIPFLKFVNMLKYKCELAGIEVICTSEQYTSKCSFIDKEPIEYHKNYLGNRTYRGLYESANRIKINADVNASYNILRKYLNEAKKTNIYELVNLVEVCSTPIVYTVGIN